MNWSTSKGLQLTITISIALAVLISVVYKASHASITHDEASTYLNLVEGSTLKLWSCYHDPSCWTNANNHLLNTVLIRYSMSLFAHTEFSLRLPNLLLLVVYLFCIVLFIRETARTIVETFFGTALFVCNPFVLDFFGLARGYGMGLGFMMLSLFAMWRYLSRGNATNVILALITAIAAVFANLTYIAYVVALLGALLLWVIFPMLKGPRRQMSIAIPLSLVCSIAFLAWYFYQPIRILIGHGEFEYGASSLWESWKAFANDSLDGVRWIGLKTNEIGAIVSAFVIGVCLVATWIRQKQERKKTETAYCRFINGLTVIMLAFFILNHLVTGASYPIGRKAIIFFPLACMLVYLNVLRYFGQRVWSSVIIVIPGVLMLTHLVRAFDFKTYREWWYDRNTKDMILYVAEKVNPGDTISVGTEWIFQPASDFYVKSLALPIRPIPYTREVSPELPVDYYYIQSEHGAKLEATFVIDTNFDGRLLMRHKD